MVDFTSGVVQIFFKFCLVTTQTTDSPMSTNESQTILLYFLNILSRPGLSPFILNNAFLTENYSNTRKFVVWASVILHLGNFGFFLTRARNQLHNHQENLALLSCIMVNASLLGASIIISLENHCSEYVHLANNLTTLPRKLGKSLIL